MSLINRPLTRRAALQLAASALPLGAWQSFYWGKDEPLPRQIPLTAGPLTMVFEPELGFLRYVRLGELEVVRGIYAAVRDRNWGTVAPRVSGLKVETGEGSFVASFDVLCKEGPIDFLWKGQITGTPAGRVQFSMEGEARSTFLRNRIGFCVLHPIAECAGNWCTVQHGDGSKEQGKFPLLVSPHQPFKDMVSIAHEVERGVTATVLFEGETFEMEDHRNWTDASYKTYCTPLEKPFPVEVPKGAKIRQAVIVDVGGASPESRQRKTFAVRSKAVEITLAAGDVQPVPQIGLGLSGVAPALGRLKPAHLRVDLEQALQAPAGLPLEVAVHLTGDGAAQMDQAAALLSKKARVVRWLIYHKEEKSTSAKWLRFVKTGVKGAPVGGGTNAYFAELNRGRPEPVGDFDFLCYSVNPQVHAFDNASLVENLAAQADSVVSAKQFAGGKPIVVTPVTLLPRFNPNATEAVTGPPPADPRQGSLFGAGWTLGSLKYLAEGGAGSVTYYETLGPRGVMETEGVYPLYHVLADVLDFAGGDVRRSKSSVPLAVESLVLRKANRYRVMVANLTPEARVVRVAWPGTGSATVQVRKLDDRSVQEAMRSPENWRLRPGAAMQAVSGVLDLALSAYAVATIDG
jgi:hypothetical protein